MELTVDSASKDVAAIVEKTMSGMRATVPCGEHMTDVAWAHAASAAATTSASARAPGGAGERAGCPMDKSERDGDNVRILARGKRGKEKGKPLVTSTLRTVERRPSARLKDGLCLIRIGHFPALQTIPQPLFLNLG